MSMKLIALGNVLMGDDGIAIEIAGLIEEELTAMGIEVIYGETDLGYCITKVENGDFCFLLDGACLGKKPGELTVLPLHSSGTKECKITEHGVNFIDLLAFYYPRSEGVILAVEIADIDFRYGISTVLMERIQDTADKILFYVKKYNQTAYKC